MGFKQAPAFLIDTYYYISKFIFDRHNYWSITVIRTSKFSDSHFKNLVLPTSNHFLSWSESLLSCKVCWKIKFRKSFLVNVIIQASHFGTWRFPFQKLAFPKPNYFLSWSGIPSFLQGLLKDRISIFIFSKSMLIGIHSFSQQFLHSLGLFSLIGIDSFSILHDLSFSTFLSALSSFAVIVIYFLWAQENNTGNKNVYLWKQRCHPSNELYFQISRGYMSSFWTAPGCSRWTILPYRHGDWDGGEAMCHVLFKNNGNFTWIKPEVL